MPHTDSTICSALPPFDPFRAKTVEPIRITTAAERRDVLAECENDLFGVPSDAVMVDLLTDSGTGAMSAAQWAAMMRSDESYAGSASFRRCVESVTRLTGISNVLPLHQGRIAERVLAETIIGKPELRAARRTKTPIVPNNAHFDTTRHMIESSGAQAVNLLSRVGIDPRTDAPFKGDIDVAALERLLNAQGDVVPFVMLTVTCNSNGGQPVSLANMHAVRDLCDAFGKMLILDACRFAENAYFIQQRESGQSTRSVQAIVREIFDLSDGAAMSTRKDGLCNVGGLLLLRDDALHQRACQSCVLTHGFTKTYGSLPARDLEAIAVGLSEAVDEHALAQRAAMIGILAHELQSGGVTIVEPVGGHAVFINAAAFCPHITDNPGHALACAIYEYAGVRSTPIGSVLIDPNTGVAPELVRLAIPRRTYNQSHMHYVATAITKLRGEAHRITHRTPSSMTAEIAMLEHAWR